MQAAAGGMEIFRMKSKATRYSRVARPKSETTTSYSRESFLTACIYVGRRALGVYMRLKKRQEYPEVRQRQSDWSPPVIYIFHKYSAAKAKSYAGTGGGGEKKASSLGF